MKIWRAHDGHGFEVGKRMAAFQSFDDLQDALSLATGIATDAMICMTADGDHLTQDVMRHISTSEGVSEADDVEFFVYNRDFLFADLDALQQELALPITLHAPVADFELASPPTPKSLASLLGWSTQLLACLNEHTSSARLFHSHLAAIQRSTLVALSNLNTHSETVRGHFTKVQESAEKELERMRGLLEGNQTDLKALSLVPINPRLLPGESSKSTTGGSMSKGGIKERTLAHYVHASKMGAVFNSCSEVHTELQQRLEEVRGYAAQLGGDTDGLREEVEVTNIQPSQETLEGAEQALLRAEEVNSYLLETCSPDEHGWPVAEALSADVNALSQVEGSVGELILLDEVGRESVRRLTADNNELVHRSLEILGDISSLQSDYADLAASLTALEQDLRSNKTDGFRHLARLKNMVFAYGATLVEVVRRREFAAHFMAKAHAVAELMARLSANERKRREEYRSEVMGLLPWEVKGLEEAPLSLEISTSKGDSALADLSRDDVRLFLTTLDDVEIAIQAESASREQAAALSRPMQMVKEALNQLLTRLDETEDDFSALVEAGLLGRGKSSEDGDSEYSDPQANGAPQTRNWNRAADSKAKAALEEAQQRAGRLEHELIEARNLAQERERIDAEAHDAEVAKLRVEMGQLRAELRTKNSELGKERGERQANARAVENLKAAAETEAARRLNMADELGRLRRDAEDARRAEADARAEATEESERATELEAHTVDLQSELEDAKAARLDASNRIEALLGQGTTTERELSAAQEHIDGLVSQLATTRAEMREARDALTEAEQARDKALRSYRAEVDGDRAILEETLKRTQTELERTKKALEQIEGEIFVHKEAAETLRGQLRAADETHEDTVRQAMDAEVARRHAERQLHNLLAGSRPLVAKTIQLRKFIRSMPALSSSKSKTSDGIAVDIVNEEIDESTEDQRQVAIDAFEAAAADANVETVCAALRALHFGSTQGNAPDEARAKLDSLTTLVRKWQKAYRNSSEKVARASNAARERIAFRNFAAGDLALFLPTRNAASSVRPWAAFNISFPHYFLNAKGVLASQLQTKEWIVARITNIDERIASNAVRQGDDGSVNNPMQLAEGSRFYMLDVDGWSNTSSSSAAASANAADVAPALRTRRSTSNVPTAPPSKAGELGGSAEPHTRLQRALTDATAGLKETRADATLGAMQRGELGVAGWDVPNSAADDIGLPPESPDVSLRDDRAPALTSVENKVDNSGVAETSAASQSRAPSPSGITRAFRSSSRASSPETGRYSAILGASARTQWPRPASLGQDRALGPIDRSLPDTTAPAFGKLKPRNRLAAPAIRSTPHSLVASPTSVVGAASSQNSAPLQTSGAALISGLTKSAAKAPTPNPFSQSPAGPGVWNQPETADYFARQRKHSLLGQEVRTGSLKASGDEDASAINSASKDPVSGETAARLPRSTSARSNRVSVSGNSLMLAHLGSSTVSVGVSQGASPSAAITTMDSALGQTASKSPIKRATSVASSSAGGSGYSKTDSQFSLVGETHSSTVGRSAGRPSKPSSPSFARLAMTWGRSRGAPRTPGLNDDGASASGMSSRSVRDATNMEATITGAQTVSDGGGQRSEASEALRRFAAARRDTS
ncbi:hypothetical protein IE81DRAFT_366694 [Ceraceosorus guamensis]|uniref:Autophagy-related protein 11 n=1 Tax=Ceraceosorus guamensis TaxID=1522189 RepID=A0A316VYK4_9BASI|nr:hypothetical protein IE81DRAFT_366694 [Ceraceosorus guamensis]PWN42414.1 hypothetical protein IE81DRAFT_366694 [Ceraceosorus guamensis]